MKPEERPGLGRKIVVTDEGIDPAVVETIDRWPLKEKTDEPDQPVPEFEPQLPLTSADPPRE
jgi:hypothetical protein